MLLSTTILGCAKRRPDDSDGKVEQSVDSRVFYPKLLEIAKHYTTYRLVDTQARIAPTLCAPAFPLPQISFSKSADLDSHGKKLYLLFASDLNAYQIADKQPSPLGQVLVKESWSAIAKGDDITGWKPDVEHKSGNVFTRHTWVGDQRFVIGTQGELFIMYKTAPDSPGTDEGWVYGVVSADGNQVINAGRLGNCMSCHVDAGKDRLFGLPTSSADAP